MTPGEAPAAIKKATQEAVTETNHKVMQKGYRVANALRNSVIEVLTNPSPSSPGEPPGIRSGHLRGAWNYGVRGGGGSGGVSIVAFGEAQAGYAGYLEDGTRKMAARPYVDKIMEDVQPEVDSIFADL